MRNLSLQYLKDEANHISAPMSDATIADNVSASNDEVKGLTWEELNKIISKLPDGYSKVFRLAVLDGLSHKEIAAQLGIAPHSSSSQLAHAKAMLRRMIKQSRMEMSILSIIGLIVSIWYGLIRHKEETPSDLIISKNTDKELHSDSIVDTKSTTGSISSSSKIIYHVTRNSETQKNITEMTVPNYGVPFVTNDSIKVIPNIINREEFIAKGNLSNTKHPENHDWSLALSYSGNFGQNGLKRYRIPIPGMPDVEGPSGDIEVTEKSHHYMPLVIGLSVNKSLTSCWGIETGVRYTFLRSDFLSDHELMNKKTIQRIHYIGIPLKLNYRIVAYNGFSLYVQGGTVLDVPVHSSQSIWEYSPKLGINDANVINIHAPLQWSLEEGFGIQYHFTPSFSIYAEPSLRYYFNPDSDIKTIRQDKPFEFAIPFGWRLTW